MIVWSKKFVEVATVDYSIICTRATSYKLGRREQDQFISLTIYYVIKAAKADIFHVNAAPLSLSVVCCCRDEIMGEWPVVLWELSVTPNPSIHII